MPATAGDTANVRVWLNGDVRVATVGTTAPTDTSTAWAAGWSKLGLLSEDGLTTEMENDSNDFFAWGGIKVKTVRSKFSRTFKVTALENSDVVYKLVNPGSTSATATGITTRTVKNPTSDIRAFGFEKSDGSTISRIVVPRGEVTEVAEVKSSADEMTMYELTISVYPASDGTQYIEITNDAAAAV